MYYFNLFKLFTKQGHVEHACSISLTTHVCFEMAYMEVSQYLNSLTVTNIMLEKKQCEHVCCCFLK